MNRFIRYQAATIRDHRILLVMHREHATGQSRWVIPGGGREPGETEEDCVRREMLEETSLDVMVERLLLDDPGIPDDVYKRRRTYVCRVNNGEAKPGFDPEVEVAQIYEIAAVRWFDMRDPDSWEPGLRNDPVTFPLLQRIRTVLGYSTADRHSLPFDQETK
jgi:8-oxo-dGTP pyrophosphatase MutT (NUDIX family)